MQGFFFQASAELVKAPSAVLPAQPVSPANANLALMRKIDELHLEHPFMGARMLRDQLARQGIYAGRRHIRTLMLPHGY